MFENYKIKNLMFNKAKKIKSIKIKSGERVLKISDNGMLKNVKLKKYSKDYNLVILCTGSNSSLVKNIFHDEFIKNSYKETSITAVLNHSSIKNNIARQIFLDDEILALLPISNTKTSIVWSVKKHNKKSNKILKKQIKFYANNFLKNIKIASEIEFKNLNFLIRSNYYKNRVLLFGDALHVVHPFVGQGFNMTLRDLATLEKILEKKIKLGLDIGSSDILSEFSKETKSGNFLFSLGIDLLKNSFSIKNNYFKKIRNELFIKINNNILAKDLFFNIADKGLKF
jgi:2-octaprenyl-6-methoxyphenol hydroxylase